MDTYHYISGHSVEIRVKTNQARMLVEAEQERLINLAKAAGAETIQTLPTWRRYLGQSLVNLGNRVAGKVNPTTAS